MNYLGGKARLAPHLGPIISEYASNKRIYVEPFCGGCSITAAVDHPYRFASDAHPDLIMMWKALQDGWEPPDSISREEYKVLKDAPPSPLRAFAGFASSFAGKWFGGYASGRDYVGSAKRVLKKRITKLQDVVFRNQFYWQIEPTNEMLIYCDPPYDGTTGYAGLPKFSSKDFWEWCRMAGQAGATVLVSEETAPDDFERIWEKPVARMGRRGGGSTKDAAVEALFRYRG